MYNVYTKEYADQLIFTHVKNSGFSPRSKPEYSEPPSSQPRAFFQAEPHGQSLFQL